MSGHEFKIGDVVQLKSGGPKMTIEDRKDDGRFGCVWFDGLTTVREDFASEILTSANQRGITGKAIRG